MRVLRIEWHERGPRVYLFRRRVHEYQLGLIALAAALAAVAVTGVSVAIEALLLAGFWLLVKDWRDLFRPTRDTCTWGLGVHRRTRPVQSSRRAGWLPGFAAAIAGTIATVNIASALTPDIAWRRHLLLLVEPVSAIPLFHALVLPAGAALLVAAIYLKRRRRRAWQLAFVLLLSLGALDLAKGLDLEEALLTWAGAAALWWGRAAFDVRSPPGNLRALAVRVPAVGLASLALAFLSVWALAPDEPGAGLIARDAIDLLAWQPGPIVFTDERTWLPLGVGLISLVALFFSARLVFRPLAVLRTLPDMQTRRAAAALVRSHGSDTLSFFKLRQDTSCFFSSDSRAFVGYTVESNVLLVSGDPVGPREALLELLRELCAFAELRGLRVGAIGASENVLPVYRQAGFRALYVGDEAVVETERFSLEGRAIRKVRQSVTRLTKAGYTTWLHLLRDLDDEAIIELEGVSDRWRQGASERGFSMAMDSLRGEHLAESVVVVARDGDGKVRGFLHFVPTYGRAAMSLSLVRWDRSAPNGLSEFLVASALELLRSRSITEVSLNFAAFARLLHVPGGARLLGRLIALGNRYFQIESLYRFNAKFFPRWVPRYLIYESLVSLPRTSLAVLWAEGQLPRPRLPRLSFLRQPR